MEYPPLPGVPLPVFEDGTPEWQEQRRGGIGSSDASIILGLSQYGSPRSLWAEKTGRAPYTPTTPDMERLRQFGHIMEPVIRDLTAAELGVGIMKPAGAVHNEQIPWLRANLDGWTTDGRVAEFKNVHQSQARQWDGQIPDHAELQVHHSGLVLGVRYAVVGGLIGGNRIAVYELDLNSAIADIVYEAEAEFWRHVESDTPPPVDGHKQTLATLLAEWPARPEPMQVDEQSVAGWVEQYRDAAAAEKQAQERKREAQARLAELMDGHDELATGERTWARIQGGRLDEARLKFQHPDIWKKYMQQKPAFDLARFKKEQADLYKAYQFKTLRVQD